MKNFPTRPALTVASDVYTEHFPKNAQLRGLYPLTLPSVASQVANSTGLRVCMKMVLDRVNSKPEYTERRHIPWTYKLTHQALTGAQIANYSTTGNTLQDVFGIPCN